MRDTLNKRIAITVISIILIFSITFSNTLPVYAQEVSNETPTPIVMQTETPEPTSEPTEVLTLEPTVEPTVEPTEVLTVEPIETIELLSANDDNYQAIVVEGMIITSGTGGICAYQISDSSKVWCFNQLNQIQISGISDSKLIIAGVDNITGLVNLAALDLAQGILLWQIDLGRSGNQGFHCSPPSNNLVHCSIASSLTAVNLNSQAIGWSLDLDGNGSLPVVNEDRVALVTPSTVYMLGTNNGEVLWTKSLGSDTEINPIIAGTILILNGIDGHFHGMELSDGSEIWAHPSAGGTPCQAIFGDDALIISTANGIIERLDNQTGNSLWTYDPGLDEMGGCPSLVMASGIVYSNFSDGSVRGISVEDGTLSWQQVILGQVEVNLWDTLALAISVEQLFLVAPNGTILGIRELVETTPTEEPTLEETISPEETSTLTPTVQPTEATQENDIEMQSACDPILISPEEGYVATSQTVTFTWSLPEGCTYATHEFVLDIDSDMVYPFVLHIGIPSSIASFTYKIDTADNNKDLYWGVQGRNPNSDYTDWVVRSIHTDFPSVEISHSLPLFLGDKKEEYRVPLYFLPKEGSTSLTAVTLGNYVTNNSVTWSIQSGVGSLSDSTGSSTIFNAGSSESDTVVRATSVQYPEVYNEFSIHTFADFRLRMQNYESVLYDFPNQFIFDPEMDEYDHSDVATRELLGVTIEGGGSISPFSGGINFYSPSTEQSTVFHLYLKPYPAYSRDIIVNTVYGGPINFFEQCFNPDQWGVSGGDSGANYPRIYSIYYQYAPIGENSTIKLGISVSPPANDPIQEVKVIFRDNYSGSMDELYGPYYLQWESGTTTNGFWSGTIPFKNRMCFPKIIMKASNSTDTNQLALFEYGEWGSDDVPVRPETTGVYDASFNVGLGVDAHSNVNSIVQLDDAKLLIVGDFTSYNGTPAGRIARLNSDGSLDSTFLSGSGADWTIHTIALQPDGKILIGGSFTSVNGIPLPGIARLNEDGSVDSSFDPGSGFDYTVYTIQVQADGKIFVGGNFSRYDGNPAYDLIRLNSDGSIDSSFNVGIGADAGVYDSLLLSDGKFLIVGLFGRYNRITSPHLARINPDGSLDQTFIPPFAQSNMEVRQYKNITLSSSGNIYFTGKVLSTGDGLIDRLSPAGVWDSSLYDRSRLRGFINSVSELVDGRILVAGTFYKGGYNTTFLAPHLVMLNPDGSLDTSFKAFTNQFGMIDQLLPISDTNLFAVGRFTVIDGVDSNGIALLSMETPATILSTLLPDAKVDSQYNFKFSTMGVPLPTLSIFSGTLPTGLTFDPVSAELAGIPEEAGVFTFTVSSTNGIDPAASKEFTLTVDEPDAPLQILSISPSELNVTFNAAREITVNGTGFLESDTVELDGKSLITSFISENQLIATIPPSELQIGRTTVITVHSTASGELISNGVELLITYRLPMIIGLTNPQFAYIGNSSIQLAVGGNYFINGSIVRWNGSDRPTTFVNGYYLTALIDAADFAEASTASVTVFNPSPGGGTSNSVSFMVLGYSPVYDQKMNTNKVHLDWDDVPDATQYSVQLSLSNAFTTNLINTTIANSEYSYSTALTNGKPYYWRIRPMFGSTLGDWSPVFRFYSMTPPAAPVLSSPATAFLTNNPTPTFSWNSVANASKYEIQIDNASTFTMPIQQTNTTSELTYTETDLEDGLHYWRVRGIDEVGVTGAWSAVRSFTLDTIAPAGPVLSLPAAEASPLGTPAFSWTVPSTAKAYIFEYTTENDGSFATPVYTSAELTTNKVTPPTIATGPYLWHAKARDAAGNWSNWSAAREITILPPIPVAPVLTAPATGSYTNDTTPELNWNEVPYGEEYEVQLSKSKTFLPLVDTLTVEGDSITNVTTNGDGLYYWRVRAINEKEETGAWSGYRTFTLDTVSQAVPVMTSPINGTTIVTVTPKMVVKTVTGAKTYEYEFSNSNTMDPVIQTASTTALSYTLSVAKSLPFGTIFYHVRSVDAAGNVSAWSEVYSFLVTIQTTPTNGTNLITSTTARPKFSWTAVVGATGYKLQIGNVGDNFETVELEKNLVVSSTYALSSVEALVAGKYEWRMCVKRGVDCGDGEWTPVYAFTVSPAPPLGPVLLSPATGNITNDNTPEFSWNASVNGVKYEIQIDNSSTFTLPIEQTGEVNGVGYSAEELTNGVHYWRVRAVNYLDVPGAWSGAKSITVDTLPQAVPAMTSPINGATVTTVIPSMVVKTVTGAKTYEYEFSTSNTMDPVIQTASTTALSYTLPVAKSIPFGTIYYHVRSVDAAGNVSAWSEPYSFVVTILKAPANKAVMVTSTTTRPAFNWTAVSGATGYRLQIGIVGNNFGENTLQKDLGKVTTYTLTALEGLSANKYEWRMCVKRGADCVDGEWTPVYAFTVTPALPLAPGLSSPANAAFTNDNTPTLEWNEALNVVKYELQISISTSFSILEQSSVLDPGVLTYTTTTLPDGKHYWRVRSINYLNVPGAWSAYRSLIVDTVAPNLPILSAPAINAEVRGTPKYTWLAGTGAKYYQYENALTADFSNVVYTSGELNSLYYTPPLQAPGPFYWHVRAKDAAGNWGGWSTYRQITLLP